MQRVRDALLAAGYSGEVGGALHPGKQRQDVIAWAINRCAHANREFGIRF